MEFNALSITNKSEWKLENVKDLIKFGNIGRYNLDTCQQISSFNSKGNYLAST